MNIRRWTAFGVFFLAMIGTSAAGIAQGRIRLQPVLTIGGPDADLIFLWTGIAVDVNDDIYLVDTLDYAVKKFDPRGRLLKKTGRKGQGPGEFTQAVGLAVAGGFVYVWDLNVKALQVFSRDLVFQKSLPLPGTVDGLSRRPDGTLAAAIRTSAGAEKFIILTADGRITREFGLTDSRSLILTESVGLASGPSGDIFFGYLFRDLVEKRNDRGERLWARSLWGGKTPAAVETHGFKIPTETCILSVACDSRGRLYALGGKKAKYQAREVAVFEADGSAAAGFVLPEPSHTIYVDHHDDLYVAADGGVTLKKYRLVRD